MRASFSSWPIISGITPYCAKPWQSHNRQPDGCQCGCPKAARVSCRRPRFSNTNFFRKPALETRSKDVGQQQQQARNGDPCTTRTCDIPLRRRMLYPAELRGQPCPFKHDQCLRQGCHGAQSLTNATRSCERALPYDRHHDPCLQTPQARPQGIPAVAPERRFRMYLKWFFALVRPLPRLTVAE